jgi:guanylate kinase
MLIILIGKKGVGKLSIMHKLMEEYGYQPFINRVMMK